MDSGHSFMGCLLASKPNKILAIDFKLLEPSWNGLENILVMMDVFSKFTVTVPTQDLMYFYLLCEWFYKFGMECFLYSNQGRSFESALNHQLCSLYGVTKSFTTPYHLAGYDQWELFNQLFTTFFVPFQPRGNKTGLPVYDR